MAVHPRGRSWVSARCVVPSPNRPSGASTQATTPSELRCLLSTVGMPMAFHQMVVDHAGGLHEGVDDGRPAELEAAARQLLRHRPRHRGLGRNLRRRPVAVDLRFPVEEAPQQAGEARLFLHHVEIGARGEHRAFDLHAVAHDAGVEHELLVERTVVEFRRAPFLVVVGDVERVQPRPRAAGEAVGMEEGGHGWIDVCKHGGDEFATKGGTVRREGPTQPGPSRSRKTSRITSATIVGRLFVKPSTLRSRRSTLRSRPSTFCSTPSTLRSTRSSRDLIAARSSLLRRVCSRMWRVTIFSPSTSRSSTAARPAKWSNSPLVTSVAIARTLSLLGDLTITGHAFQCITTGPARSRLSARGLFRPKPLE